MTTSFLRTLLWSFLMASVLIISCDKKDEPDDLSSVLKFGTWRVTHYMNSSGDLTSEFIGYNLKFNAMGPVTATKNGTTIHGYWSMGTDPKKLTFTFLNETYNYPFNQMSDEWLVGSFNSTQVSLTAEFNTSEMLVLQKN